MCARNSTAESKEKEIFQYSSYGAYIKMFNSIKEAKEQLGFNSISPSSTEKKTSGGFIWLLERDDDKALEIAATINQSRTVFKNLPVLQYSIDGSFIKRYSSSGEAERENGIARSKVGTCCRGKSKTAGGYIWCYDIEDN